MKENLVFAKLSCVEFSMVISDIYETNYEGETNYISSQIHLNFDKIDEIDKEHSYKTTIVFALPDEIFTNEEDEQADLHDSIEDNNFITFEGIYSPEEAILEMFPFEKFVLEGPLYFFVGYCNGIHYTDEERDGDRYTLTTYVNHHTDGEGYIIKVGQIF